MLYIIYVDRNDVAKDSNEVFFRKIKFWEDGGDAPPVFNTEGVNFIWIKQSGLYFAGTTKVCICIYELVV